MKKALIIYRIFQDDNSSRAIHQKMLQQAKAIAKYEIEVDVCIMKTDGIYINHKKIVTFSGNNMLYSVWNRLRFFHLVANSVRNSYDIYFIRFAPLSLHLKNALDLLQTSKVYLEMPTYPFVDEYKGIVKIALKLLLNKQKDMSDAVTNVLHSGKETVIFGTPVIHFENGIDIGSYTLKTHLKISKDIHLIAVGALWSWFGLDRVLRAMMDYRSNEFNIFLTIIGEGEQKEGIQKFIIDHGLSHNVKLLPALFGRELDMYFDQAHFAIGCLGLHRKNLAYSNALKHREYSARGIPFVYAGSDPFFDEKPYSYSIGLSDDAINLDTLIEFIIGLYKDENMPLKIRTDAEKLSWEYQYEFLKYII